jgi:glutaredoxin
MSKATVLIYTREGCHLCDEAKTNILASDLRDLFEVHEVNIDEEPALKQRFGYDIPVIFINGVKVFKHRVSTVEFDRKLHRLIRE